MTEDKKYEALLGNLNQLMATPYGKAVIWDILSSCGIYSEVPGKFEAGKRSIGLNILSLMEDADSKMYPNLLLTMQSEKDNGR